MFDENIAEPNNLIQHPQQTLPDKSNNVELCCANMLGLFEQAQRFFPVSYIMCHQK